jgi:rhodanese-related sulfurtransferase
MNFLQKLFGGPDLGSYLEQDAVIIDVRTRAEFKDAHGDKAINIPLDEVPRNLEKIKKYNKPVIACCRSGARSGSATDFLRANGIDAVNGGPWQTVQRALTAHQE